MSSAWRLASCHRLPFLVAGFDECRVEALVAVFIVRSFTLPKPIQTNSHSNPCSLAGKRSSLGFV